MVGRGVFRGVLFVRLLVLLLACLGAVLALTYIMLLLHEHSTLSMVKVNESVVGVVNTTLTSLGVLTISNTFMISIIVGFLGLGLIVTALIFYLLIRWLLVGSEG